MKAVQLDEVARVVASAESLSAAARQLELDRSTLYRWIQDGHISAPKTRRRTTTSQPSVNAGQSPEAWGRWVRREFDLDATEEALLQLAVDALTLARDAQARPEVRLAAMGRYQALTRQLELEGEPEDGQAEDSTVTSIRQFPRRV